MRNLSKYGLASSLAASAAAAWALALATPAHADDAFEPYASLSADGRYDDYVPGGGHGLVTRIAPGLGTRVHSERLVLRLDYQLAYDRYEVTVRPVPDSWNHHAVLDTDFRATRRLTLRLSDHFTRALDPRELDRAGIVTPPGVQITDNVGGVGAEYLVTRRLSVESGYQYRFTEYGDFATGNMAAIPIPGGQEHDFLAGVAERLTPNDTVRGRFQAQLFIVGANAQAYTPSLGYTRRLTPYLSAEAEAGPLFYVDEALMGPTATTWHARAATFLDTPRWKVIGSFDRSLLGGTGAAGVIWADYAGATARYRPRTWLDLTAGAAYFRSGIAPSEPVRIDGFDLTAEALFRLGESFALSTYYLFRRQVDRDPTELSFHRDVVGLRLTALFAPSPRTAKEVR